MLIIGYSAFILFFYILIAFIVGTVKKNNGIMLIGRTHENDKYRAREDFLLNPTAAHGLREMHTRSARVM